MRRTLATVGAIGALALSGCKQSDQQKTDAVASAVKTVVLVANTTADSTTPQKVLSALSATTSHVNPNIRSSTEQTAPMTVVESPFSATTGQDKAVCRAVVQTDDGAVIRKVGGLIRPAYRNPDEITVILPNPDSHTDVPPKRRSSARPFSMNID